MFPTVAPNSRIAANSATVPSANAIADHRHGLGRGESACEPGHREAGHDPTPGEPGDH